MSAIGLGILAVVVSFGLLACGGGSSTKEEPTPVASATPSDAAQQALSKQIETSFAAQYGGDCGAQPAAEHGKFCSVVRGERDGVRAYAVGPVGAEGRAWIFLANQNGQWNVAQVKQITRDSSAVPGIPWPLRTGVDVVVAGAGVCRTVGNGLNVREGPSLQQRAVDCLSDGMRIKLATGPVDGDNLIWWQIEGRAGWVTDTYLRYPDAAQ